MPPQLLIVLTGLGLVVGIGAALGLATFSIGSRNIALATGALIGAALLLAVQVWFESRDPPAEVDVISVELTVARSTPTIRQPIWWVSTDSERISYEIEASKWLATNRSALFNDDRLRLTTDLAIAEVLVFLGRKEFDWQLSRTRFAGRSGSSVEITQRVSEKGDCTELTAADLGEILRDSGNVVADFEVPPKGGALCLPPRATVTLGPRTLTIAEPFGTLTLELDTRGGVNYVPGPGSGAPRMTNGEFQFETRVIVIRAIDQKSGLYSQRPEAAKHDAWRRRIVAGLQQWFEDDGQ